MAFYSWQEDIEKACLRCEIVLYVFAILLFNLCVSVYSWHSCDTKRVYWTCAYIYVMVSYTTFNNISIILLRSVLLVEGNGVCSKSL